MSTESDFLDYVATQEKNLLVSLAELHTPIRLFRILDDLYRDALKRIDVPESNATTALLLVAVHAELYFTFVTALRSNVSQALAASRKAIDLTLTAYRIREEPEYLAVYKAGGVLNIKGDIKKRRRRDPTCYPLAEFLVTFHEYCSKMACHADYAGIEPRLVIQKISDSKSLQVYHYCDVPVDRDAYHCLLVNILAVFHRMLEVFAPFVVAHMNDSDTWQRSLEALGVSVRREVESCGGARDKGLTPGD